MDKYKLTRGSHARVENGKRVYYEEGDIFEPSEAELQAFGDKLEPAPEPGPPPDPDPEPDGSQLEEPSADAGDEEEHEESSEDSDEEDAELFTGDLSEMIEHVGGGYYRLPNGDKEKGKEAAIEELKKLIKEGEI